MSRTLHRTGAIALAGALGAAAVLVACAPAWWVARALPARSGGHVLLLEPEGTLWRGEGILVLADPGARDPGGVRLPGRIGWRIAPWPLLRGALHVQLEDETAFAAPIVLEASGGPREGPRLVLEAGALGLPAAALAGMGAPWNTVRPGGVLRLSWGALQFDRDGLRGTWTAEWQGATSALSPVSPFGHYRLHGDGTGATGGTLGLETLGGPLEMTGDGTIGNDGRLRFHGLARVQAGTDETVATQLSGLVSLLGRRDGDAAILDFGN
jgi:general secretion pathway protein N